MKARSFRVSLGASGLALAATVAAGQAAARPTDAPIAVAGLAEGIRLDGVLSEPGWFRATPIGPLRQREPKEAAPPSEETEVRVLFDADNLYFGIICRTAQLPPSSRHSSPETRTSRWMTGSSSSSTPSSTTAMASSSQ